MKQQTVIRIFPAATTGVFAGPTLGSACFVHGPWADALGMKPGQTGTLTWEPDVKSVRPYQRPQYGSYPKYLCGACGCSYLSPAFTCGTCGAINRGEAVPWPEPQ